MQQKDIQSTYKSNDTEGLYGLGMNIGAICLLAWANFYDSADGQLARMTGQKTQLGRILDGAASEVWFIPIYIALVYRFYIHHALEFQWLGIADTPTNAAIATGLLLLFVLYSGFVCHSGQCGLADYYRQIHLFFLKGEAGSELDNSAAQQRSYDATPWPGNRLWKTFLRTYIRYTRSQEQRTPAFQRLMNLLRERYGTADHIPQEFRNRFRAQSLPLMKWTNILTFNTRAIVLCAVCLADQPWLYFLFEVFVMGALCAYMHRKHERICQALYKVPYPLLILPNANLSYTIQPETYTNLNALEFINDEYFSWDVTYYMNGNLLNRLPLIKKLKWREVFGFRGLWGNLTDKNNPRLHPEGLYRFPATTYEMNQTPYMEASVGIENIFKFLRVDYVWRLTYLEHEDIQKSGVRMTMVLSF